MTKKTNPIGFRLSTNKNWQSSWFTMDKKEFVRNVFADYLIRKQIEKFYKNNVFSSLHISRVENRTEVKLVSDNALAFTGKNDYLLNLLKAKLNSIEENINITVEQKNFISAKYVSGLIANFITTGKMPWKIIMRKLIRRIMEQKPLGYKIKLSGRLNNSDKHKVFKTSSGKVSSNTLNNNIDYSCQVAVSKVGTISVKTWINYAAVT